MRIKSEDRRTNRHEDVSAASVAANPESSEGVAPSVLEVLGELAGCREGGLAGAERRCRLGVLHELMEAEVDEVVGLKGKHDPGCRAVRHGHDGEASVPGLDDAGRLCMALRGRDLVVGLLGAGPA